MRYVRALRTIPAQWEVAWGLLLDTLMLPVALLMLLIKWLVRRDLDACIPHDTALPPALLIHGSGANDMQFIPAALFLRKAFDVYTLSLPNGRAASIDGTMADAAHQKLRWIRDRTGHDRVTVIGHSMGGLVAVFVALQAPQAVAAVVTIGSPWRGAPALSHLTFYTRRHQQMTPGSEMLQRLRLPTGVPCLAIAMTGDPQVPCMHALPARACDGLVLDGLGHTSAMLSRKLWASVATWARTRCATGS